jgi:hypothetical protein
LLWYNLFLILMFTYVYQVKDQYTYARFSQKDYFAPKKAKIAIFQKTFIAARPLP